MDGHAFLYAQLPGKQLDGPPGGVSPSKAIELGLKGDAGLGRRIDGDGVEEANRNHHRVDAVIPALVLFGINPQVEVDLAGCLDGLSK